MALPVIRDRLIDPDDGDTTPFVLRTGGQPLIVTDPTYIADYFNERDADAGFVRSHGVVLGNFGGDLPCRLFFDRDYMLAAFTADAVARGEAAGAPSADVAIDSGSLLFLPLTADVPASLQALIAEALDQFGAVEIRPGAGQWTFFYEIGDPEDDEARNVVALRTQT